MASTADLIQRNGRWYFNRAFPVELWPITGKAPFRRSLRTTDRVEALRARPAMELQYHVEVDKARLEFAAQAAQQSRPVLTKPDAEALVAEHFRREICGAADWLDLGPPSDGAWGADDDLDRAKYRLRTGDFKQARVEALKLAEAGGFAFETSPAFAYLVRLVARADVARAEVYRARLDGDYSVRPSDPLFAGLLDQPTPASTAAASEPAPGHTLADLEAAYTADRLVNLSESTKLAYRPVFRLLRGFFGPEKPLSAITREDGRELVKLIQKLPAGLGKNPALKGVTIRQAVDIGQRMGLPTLSAKTVKVGYLGLASSIFGWALRESWMSLNPVAGIEVKDPVADKDRRDPFSVEQLNRIFAAAPWTPRDESKPIRFWAPLLALFHGLRRGEIAKMRTAEVALVEGVQTMRISSGKTKNAARLLPVHPEVLRLGFMEFVEARRGGSDPMLFPGEEANGRGQWGDGLSDWFLRRLDKLDIRGTKLGMHSFRHCFEDRLREAGLHGTAIGAELAGRTKSGMVAAAYGSGFATRALAEAIGKIAYPGVRLPAERTAQ
jgi:integrase